MVLIVSGSLLIWGIILTVGPTFLRWLLRVSSSVIPVCPGTVYVGVAFVLILVAIGVLYKSVVNGFLFKHYSNNKGKIKAMRFLLKRILTVLHVIGITGAVLIVFHPVLVGASRLWSGLMEAYPAGFQVAQYIGIVFLAMSLGFFGGMYYQQRRKLARYRQEFNRRKIERIPMREDVKQVEEETEKTEEPEEEKQPEEYYLDEEKEIKDEELEVRIPRSARQHLN